MGRLKDLQRRMGKLWVFASVCVLLLQQSLAAEVSIGEKIMLNCFFYVFKAKSRLLLLNFEFASELH